MRQFLMLALIGVSILATSCQPGQESGNNSPSSAPSSDVSEKSGGQRFELEPITGISLQLAAHVTLSPGEKQEITIQGPQEILDELNTEVYEGVWRIGTISGINTTSSFYKGEDDVKVFITMPEITSVELSSSGSIVTTGLFKTSGELILELSGSGDIHFLTEAGSVHCEVSGSGSIQVNGGARTLDAEISGSGSVQAEDLEVEAAKVEISGSGDCKVNAVDRLHAEISGSGEVLYKGDPDVRSRIWGSGDVKKYQ